MTPRQNPSSTLRGRLHEIIFEADTPAGRSFDVFLMWAIILSVVTVVLESIPAVRQEFGGVLRVLEWVFTGLFTIEYVLRLASVGKPLRYATSFYGIIDLMAILPSYLSLIIVGSQSLIVIRALRLLRIFRVLKLAHFLREANELRTALRSSVRKVIVFLGTVILLVVFLGSLMYLVEGEEHGFVSIPHGIYWAIVTLTTVGYGDIVPQTVLGRVLASMVMIIGYSIIAVPTGIVSAEMTRTFRHPVSTQACRECATEGHDIDAQFCKACGSEL